MEQPHDKPQPDTSVNRRDPRLYQIACLGALLVYGLGWRSFDVSPAQIVLTLGVALATQALGTKWAGLPAFDSKSALIWASPSASFFVSTTCG